MFLRSRLSLCLGAFIAGLLVTGTVLAGDCCVPNANPCFGNGGCETQNGDPSLFTCTIPGKPPRTATGIAFQRTATSVYGNCTALFSGATGSFTCTTGTVPCATVTVFRTATIGPPPTNTPQCLTPLCTYVVSITNSCGIPPSSSCP